MPKLMPNAKSLLVKSLLLKWAFTHCRLNSLSRADSTGEGAFCRRIHYPARRLTGLYIAGKIRLHPFYGMLGVVDPSKSHETISATHPPVTENGMDCGPSWNDFLIFLYVKTRPAERLCRHPNKHRNGFLFFL
jgi:hypothetical protein